MFFSGGMFSSPLLCNTNTMVIRSFLPRSLACDVTSANVCKYSELSYAHTTHEYTCEVSLKSYGQLFRYGEQIVARRKKERKKERRRIKRNSLTGVDTLWRKLRHEREIWRKSDQHVIWRSFPEPSFGISWVSIHWAVIEIEPPKLRLKSAELL